jgi:hypothetical protein
MNQEVPQPTTATRSPRRGRTSVNEVADSVARFQVSGWEAISADVREASWADME